MAGGLPTTAVAGAIGTGPIWGAWGNYDFWFMWSPENEVSSIEWHYPEYDIIEATPQVQWTGFDLEHIEFDLFFHMQFCTPREQLHAIIAAANLHTAYPLVMGDGTMRGWFVIENIQVTGKQTSGAGTPVAIYVKINFKEVPLNTNAAGGGGNNNNNNGDGGQNGTIPIIGPQGGGGGIGQPVITLPAGGPTAAAAGPVGAIATGPADILPLTNFNAVAPAVANRTAATPAPVLQVVSAGANNAASTSTASVLSSESLAAPASVTVPAPGGVYQVSNYTVTVLATALNPTSPSSVDAGVLYTYKIVQQITNTVTSSTTVTTTVSPSSPSFLSYIAGVMLIANKTSAAPTPQPTPTSPVAPPVTTPASPVAVPVPKPGQVISSPPYTVTVIATKQNPSNPTSTDSGVLYTYKVVQVITNTVSHTYTIGPTPVPPINETPGNVPGSFIGYIAGLIFQASSFNNSGAPPLVPVVQNS